MEGLIPEQKEGKKVDLYQSRTLWSRDETITCFDRACKRLMNPRIWHEISGVISARFYLTDDTGEDPHRLLRQNDYIKIDIPGPGPAAGDGFDWVHIAQVESHGDAHAEKESLGVKVRPCADPRHKGGDTAHFFKAVSSSTLIVSREDNTVSAFYHGRNEVHNTHTESTIDNLRNALVGSGAWAALSEMQWHNLIKGFLEDEL